ncbi:MAG: hydrogenase expression/formation C-terminal domain-containing protein [Woeseiaceae bacterium]|nr:hydrogenase expression/formation C-terminal domain-containing protein [Woeseiaceae bacterium]
MKLSDIPVRVLGPGSQPADEDGQTLSYMSMPSDMQKFVRPEVPEPDDVRDLVAARDAMRWLTDALADRGEQPRLANLAALDDESRALVNQILGEGEVSVTRTGPVPSKTQESVLAGVWRTLYQDQAGAIVADLLEVAAVPHVVVQPEPQARPVDTSADGVPEGINNALPILVELQAQLDEYRASGRPHVINLTLLPLSEEEVAFVDDRLGRGAVDVLSRAYGKCQVSSTLTPNVWWVRYYNSMGTLILNTLEVVEVPQVVLAAPEDIADSAARLADIIAPYWPELA